MSEKIPRGGLNKLIREDSQGAALLQERVDGLYRRHAVEFEELLHLWTSPQNRRKKKKKWTFAE
jgi:hypothetical protein